ncbi:DsbA family protein [Paraburkholderia sp. GAS348]|uniref:DsbA family protein n=1 Tax=Paraburkholderia sp. GAS348 TaxID=3035132 RepID=UPI003D24ABC7
MSCSRQTTPFAPSHCMPRKRTLPRVAIPIGRWPRYRLLCKQSLLEKVDECAEYRGHIRFHLSLVLEFNHALAKRTPNTLAAHRLVWVLQQRHDVTALVEAIFHAYFSAGRDIGDVAVLTEIAAATCFKKDKVEAFFASDRGVDEVRALEARAIERGVNSVPSVKIGDEIISGAQSVALFRATLENALKPSATVA